MTLYSEEHGHYSGPFRVMAIVSGDDWLAHIRERYERDNTAAEVAAAAQRGRRFYQIHAD